MDTTLKNKIVLGTTYKEQNKAKIYGQTCTPELSLLKIILELKNYCQINLEFDKEKHLERMAKALQNKYKYICKYKEKNFNDIKFIN